jgi:RES domain-containing protein
MQLWRLYREVHGPGLDGVGGLHAGGRWHEMGSRVVYLGAGAAIVVLEKLAHIDPAILPADLILARFEGDLSVADVTDAELGDVWNLTQTRQRGEAFLKGQSSCILRVPSAVVPEEHNLVFNPLHPEANALQLVYSRRFSFDGRLL